MNWDAWIMLLIGGLVGMFVLGGFLIWFSFSETDERGRPMKNDERWSMRIAGILCVGLPGVAFTACAVSLHREGKARKARG